MDEIVSSVEKSLEAKNYFGALFMAVCIPDICGKIQNPRSNTHYKEWFEQFMPSIYENHLTGGDAYALRCATLHQASNDLPLHQAADRLNKYYFTPAGSHLITLNNNNGDGVRRCVISIRAYCEDIIAAYRLWISNEVGINSEVRARYEDSEKSRIKIGVGNDIPGFSIT